VPTVSRGQYIFPFGRSVEREEVEPMGPKMLLSLLLRWHNECNSSRYLGHSDSGILVALMSCRGCNVASFGRKHQHRRERTTKLCYMTQGGMNMLKLAGGANSGIESQDEQTSGGSNDGCPGHTKSVVSVWQYGDREWTDHRCLMTRAIVS
jgi:hypothetical protein